MFGMKFDKKKAGYTLAEMLLVMAIFTIIMLALPPMARKMFKVEHKTKVHGRVECFYNGSGEGASLKKYVQDEANKTVESRTPEATDYCEFIPPANVTYIMVHAVGGGGAGYNKVEPTSYQREVKDDSGNVVESGTIHDRASLTYLSHVAVNLWPEWFSYIIQNKSSLGLNFFTKDMYEVRRTYTTIDMPYGLAGAPGEKKSLFYPALKNVKICMYPGKGGTTNTTGSGNNGTSTVIKLVQASASCTAANTDEGLIQEIEAHGGEGSVLTGEYGAPLTGGRPTDFGVSEFEAVKARTSGFENVLEDTGIENFTTNINSDTVWTGNKAGWGGNGSFHFVDKNIANKAGYFSYVINNYNLTHNSYDQAIRNSVVYRVTDKVGINFYKRSGASASCEGSKFDNSDRPLQVRGYCVQNKLGPNDCKITDFPTQCIISYGNYQDETWCIPKNDTVNDGKPKLLSPNSSSFDSCNFYENINKNQEFLCTIKNANASTDDFHKCSYTDSNAIYECPYGTRSVGTGGSSDNYCSAGDGGNGAALILW